MSFQRCSGRGWRRDKGWGWRWEFERHGGGGGVVRTPSVEQGGSGGATEWVFGGYVVRVCEADGGFGGAAVGEGCGAVLLKEVVALHGAQNGGV